MKKPHTANSTLAIGGVSSPLDSFVVAESSVLRTNFCAEKPAHRQSAKRYMQLNDAVRKQAEVFCGQLCSKLTTQSAQGKQTFTFWTKLQVVSLTA